MTHYMQLLGHASPWLLAAAGAGALIATGATARILRRVLRGKKGADVLTVVAAGMASSVAATGMWHFFTRTMHLPVWIQAILFAFMEVSVLASALRARANVARDGQAGADGLAVWVLTCVSGLMSASEAGSPQEALVRLGAPLVAAWLWERSMVPERRAQRAAQGAKETAVAWLFSVKRIAVRLGLATALGADLETEDANRRIDRFVRADNRAQRAGWLTRRHAGRRRDRAHARLTEQARMQADPRSLYAHLGRQAILDVLARLGGDDAVIDRERARQMQHILGDTETPQGGDTPIDTSHDTLAADTVDDTTPDTGVVSDTTRDSDTAADTDTIARDTVPPAATPKPPVATRPRAARVVSKLPVQNLDADVAQLNSVAISLNGGASITAWPEMSKADAIRNADRLLPGRAASQIVKALGAVGVKVDDVLVRKTRSRDRQNAATATGGDDTADKERVA